MGSHPAILDYSLTGTNAHLAVEKGLAEAEWYQCPVPRETMRKLLERRDGPAVTALALTKALMASLLARRFWRHLQAVSPQ